MEYRFSPEPVADEVDGALGDPEHPQRSHEAFPGALQRLILAQCPQQGLIDYRLGWCLGHLALGCHSGRLLTKGAAPPLLQLLEESLASLSEGYHGARPEVFIAISLPPEVAYADIGCGAEELILAAVVAAFVQTVVAQEEAIEKITLRPSGLVEVFFSHYADIVGIMPIYILGAGGVDVDGP